MIHSYTNPVDEETNWEELIFQIPLNPLILYLESALPISQIIHDPPPGKVEPSAFQVVPDFDKNQILTFLRLNPGELPPVHLNLGSPPFDPQLPTIELNAESLVIAQLQRRATIPVIFNGQIDLALEANLITKKDFDKFCAFLHSLD